MIYLGNCLEIMPIFLEDNSVDAIVTDPPYGLKFMGKKWDYKVPTIEIWVEALRVLKPGGHLLSFGGTRTYHRMVVNIEDAGFEIRDQIQWLYGSGFPKSHNISKGIDKKFKAKREVIGISENNRDRSKHNYNSVGNVGSNAMITKPSTDLAKQWEGYGTALKPANEPIVLARKPLSEKTIVDNVLKWGTGGINIDGCRINNGSPITKGGCTKIGGLYEMGMKGKKPLNPEGHSQGRFPANLLLDESAAEMLDAQSGISISRGGAFKNKTNLMQASMNNKKGNSKKGNPGLGDKGGASRFFYVAKASKSERGTDNSHPTVKPLKLIQYLTRLITPPNGIVLDPFMGSGTTGLACKNEDFNFIGIELNKEYFDIAKARIDNA